MIGITEYSCCVSPSTIARAIRVKQQVLRDLICQLFLACESMNIVLEMSVNLVQDNVLKQCCEKDGKFFIQYMLPILIAGS